MKISVVSPTELDGASIARWRSIQEAVPELSSPYFSPQFALAAASVRDDVRVAVLEEKRRVVGFFPFQRRRFGACAPVGGVLSDHHGVIAEPGAGPGTTWSWRELFRAAGLSSWRFDHLVASQATDEMTSVTACESPGIDLSKGFAAWREARLARGSRRIAELDRKARKLEREVGPVRFELEAGADVLPRVFAWKSEQCRSTGVFDYFSSARARAFVERILHTKEPSFAGALTALWAGDRLVAAHMGMRSDRTWHWWFPVYDHEMAKHSPGSIMLLRLAEAAASRGITLLDLGKGNDTYKESFADTAIPLVEGIVTTPSVMSMVHGALVQAEQKLRASSMFERMRPMLRELKRARFALEPPRV